MEKLDYPQLINKAMRGLIVNLLRTVAKNGLPGKHHFFISFNTRHPQVKMADYLRHRYPQGMTIVLQNWFESLNVHEEYFCITLNFSGSPENLRIPFKAITAFVDPSVKFQLQFKDTEIDNLAPNESKPNKEIIPITDNNKDKKIKQKLDKKPNFKSTVVSLESFRK